MWFLCVVVFAFFILHSEFFIQPARAQACIPGPTMGNTCQVPDGRTGAIDDCGNCANLSCPQTPVEQRWCNNACTPTSTILSGPCTTATISSGTYSDCGTCVANAPLTVTRQSGSYPGTAEAGFINVVGNIGSAGDVYLNSGRAIRIDNARGSSVLNLGNYTGTEFHATLHSQGTSLGELLFQQGSDDRWALSVRSGATSTASGGDFEIRRGVTGWPRVLAIDYNTGDLTLDTNVSVGGTLTVGGATVVRQPSGCTGGQVLQWNAVTSSWVCAADAVGTGATDHGALDGLADDDHLQYYREDGTDGNLTIGDSLLAYRIFPRPETGSLQIGYLSSIINVPGLLQLGTFRLPTDIQQTPISAGMLYYKSSTGGGTPTGLQVYNGSAWAAVGGAPITYTAGDYITISADNRISATHSGGCFGPTFVGVTGGSTNGQMTSGGFSGYRAAHAICASAFPASGTTPAGHMCGTQEILNSVSCGASAGTSAVFQALPLRPADGSPGRAWVANGAPSLPTQTNDCNGWAFSDPSSTVNGVAWQFNANGGVGWAQTCNESFPIACCR